MTEIYYVGHIPVRVVRRKGCRVFSLRCHAGTKALSMTAPRWCSASQIEQFLRDRLAWILDSQGSAEPFQPVYAPGEIHLLWGERVILGRDGVPAGEKAFLGYQRTELKRLIDGLLPEWERKMGVRAGGIRYREMKSRWGSCNPRTGMITLNTMLARTPKECAEYVLVHELTHLRHPDHSPAFHRELKSLLPDCDRWIFYLKTADLRPTEGES